MNAIILAGGQSRRMGRNKALLTFGGTTLVEWIARRLRPVASEIIVVAVDPSPYERLGLRAVADLIPGQGPLSGLHAGLLASREEANFLIACDMPFVNPQLAGHMAALLTKGGAATGGGAVVPRVKGRCEPLHAVYSRGCAEVIASQLAGGRNRMSDFLKMIPVRWLTEKEIRLFDDPGRVFMNVNTPDEFNSALLMSAPDPA